MSLDYKVFHGQCPDLKCQTKVFFAADKDKIECPSCGQVHFQEDLLSKEEVDDEREAVAQILKSIVHDVKLPKRNSDTVKVNGLSNYDCKLLSPFFTKYGMDKEGNPKPLKDLGHGETADCGRILCKRSFSISPKHIDVTGYGRDQTGSEDYLKCLLAIVNEEEEVLVPIHADGDGHCLVHALSRATTGREIFWHALSQNLVNHLQDNQHRYQKLFENFINEEDWGEIIEEADPDYVSSEGYHTGLRNIHIFALANVLRRPIILLDVLENVENVADYTGIFLPIFVDWVDCKDHPPLCIAWSGAGHNHFIPLVGIEDRARPTIPAQYVPKVWGVDENKARAYLQYNDDGSITIPEGQQLKETYVQRLVEAIEKVFLEKHGVSAGLVTDMHLYVFQRVGIAGLKPEFAIRKTREALDKQLLFRCLWCNGLTRLNTDMDSLTPGGFYYNIMVETHGTPDPTKIYSFPIEELQCRYDSESDRLVPNKFPCCWCKSKEMRQVDKTGKFVYQNGDPTRTPANLPGSCCGFKHFWDGREYENIPKILEINMTLKGKAIQEQIPWFYDDSDPAANSSVDSVSRRVAIKYFGENNHELPVLTTKVKHALESALRGLGLSYEQSFIKSQDSAEPEKTSSKKPEEKVETPSYISSKDPVVLKEASSLKRSSLKREANGEKKPPSPIFGSPSTDQKVISGKTEQKTVPDSLAVPAKQEVEKTNIKVRFTTSDGRLKTIDIPVDEDYPDLMALVLDEFAVQESMVILKIGFPPKRLDPTPAGQKLALRNGDRVTVEIRKEKPRKEAPVKKDASRGSLNMTHKQNASFEPTKLSGLRALAADITPRAAPSKPNLSHLDISLQAVTKMAQITKQSLWEYAVNHPELFRREGVFYNLFSREIGLIHGKHCKLSVLPGKVFWYNGEVGYDRVELCLEPLSGHYPITPRITEILKTLGIEGGQQLENGPTNSQFSSNTDPNQALSEEVTVPSKVPTEQEKMKPEIDIPESKYSGPGFLILGDKPTTVSANEARQSRDDLVEKLKSNKEKS